MLRPSASRAFSAPEGSAAVGSDPAAPRGRREAVHRLFRELYEGLRERIERLELALRIAPAIGSLQEAASPRAIEPLRLSKERTLLEGLEFVLETPGASWRFVDTLMGMIRVDRIDAGRIEEVECIGVVRDHAGLGAGSQTDRFRPVRKPLRRGAPFRSTSVAAIIEELLGDTERRIPSPGASDSTATTRERARECTDC